jgi:hypothetical protein
MSDSVAKYHELLQEGRLLQNSPHQKSIGTIVEIVRAAMVAQNLDVVLKKVVSLSLQNPEMSPATVFSIVSVEAKVDELCTPQKQKQWNNQD